MCPKIKEKPQWKYWVPDEGTIKTRGQDASYWEDNSWSKMMTVLLGERLPSKGQQQAGRPKNWASVAAPEEHFEANVAETECG